jgi:DNA-binding response OmpR family regulator
MMGAAQKILVVDDEPMVRQFLRVILESAGFEVEEAADGDEGLACCACRRYDLIIVDLMMPKKNGVEMIAELRRIDPTATILALSGLSLDESELVGDAANVGADDFAQKPFDNEVLLSKVKMLLAIRSENACAEDGV